LLLTFILFLIYCFYLIYENVTNKKYLSSFKQIIHVNGIRGKTSVCRLLDASIRGSNLKVFTKTTGSTPSIIDTYGNEKLIKRIGSANIKEQFKIIKQAYKESTDVLIIECMAINPELQKICQNKIVKSNITVITNVRYDHLLDMGKSLDEIAESLSNTIPTNGILFTADESYYDFFKKKCFYKNSDTMLCKSINSSSNVLDENIAIAYEICKYIGIDTLDFYSRIKKEKKDFGSCKLYTTENSNLYFLNLFSVNDPSSTMNILKEYIDRYDNISFLYNNREDRPDRVEIFAKYFFNNIKFNNVYIIGKNKNLAKYIFKKYKVNNVLCLTDWKDIFKIISECTLIVGIGNIKGLGYEIIKFLEGGSNNE